MQIEILHSLKSVKKKGGSIIKTNETKNYVAFLPEKKRVLQFCVIVSFSLSVESTYLTKSTS